MPRFIAGFFAASALWGALAFLYTNHMLGPLGPEEVECPEPLADAAAVDTAKAQAPKRGKKKRRPGDPRAPKGMGDDTTIGEDIGWDEERQVDFAGGEQQLTGAQIESGFDSAMAKIRRCLVLVEGDGEISGKLTFGMRVGSDGIPKAVNLTGPGLVTGGESGSCLRGAAQNIRFASFQGPDMVFKYPITLQ